MAEEDKAEEDKADEGRKRSGWSPTALGEGRSAALLVAVHALGLFMAITGGFISLIAALLGMIEWMSEEAEGYEMGDALIWFGLGALLVLLGGFLARIRDPQAPVERPDSWSSR
jgi:hypothetical protein